MTLIERSAAWGAGLLRKVGHGGAALRRRVAELGSPAARRSADLLADYRLLAGLVGGSAVVALLAIPEAPRPLALLGVVLGVVYYGLASRRERRRQRLRAAQFPAAWREILTRRVPLYAQLDDEERRRFEQEIQIFLGEQRIYALDGVPAQNEPAAVSPPRDRSPRRFAITDEHRVLIAASAATLLLGRPEWRLPLERDIIVYPTAFTEESYVMEPYSHTVGMVHAQGPVLFALDAIERSYPRLSSEPATDWNANKAGVPWLLGQSPWDAANSSGSLAPESAVLPHVGLHEFAHVLDFIGQGSHGVGAHGVPGILSTAYGERWAQQLNIERERLLVGESVLHPYGLKNEAELFAVSVESFFQEPLRLRSVHPELYGLLAEFFNQDPAARSLGPIKTALAFRPWFSMSAPVRYTA